MDDCVAEGSAPAEPTPREISKAMGSGNIPDDRVFDRHLPDDLRLASSRFWTPLEVVATVGGWLREVKARSVVDVGAGPGKFCVAAALVTNCVYFGIEHRTSLVAAAQELARRFDVEARVAFLEGEFGEVSIAGVDAFYFYNPFGENLFWVDERLDDTVPLGLHRYRRDVALARRFLVSLRVGTYVITYNGFGGRVPESFTEIRADRTLPNALRMWRKT